MFRTWKTALAFPAMLSLLLVAACGDDGAADDTAREISNEELGQMVLDLGQFGPEFAGFSPDPENTGVLNVDAASADDFDPAAERADLETFGFASGHEAYYSSDQIAEGGAFFVGSQVELFQTADGAAGYFDDTKVESTQDIGKTNQGITLMQAEQFELESTADEAAGLRGFGRFANEDGSTTDIWIAGAQFRRGRLLGTVAILAIGASDLEKKRLEGIAATLATAMNERFASILVAGPRGLAPAAALAGATVGWPGPLQVLRPSSSDLI